MNEFTVLKAARDLIAKGWTAKGVQIGKTYSITGAILAAEGGGQLFTTTAIRHVSAVTREMGFTYASDFNVHDPNPNDMIGRVLNERWPKTTQEAVLKVMDQAIARASK